MEYPTESYTPEERARLAPHFTDLDGPVFALVNLPETVKGALFARYSRYPGTLRRLFLDEFADSLPAQPTAYESEEGERAAKLYETIFLGYGDDSVAQLGGMHVACEWVSNVMTKVLQRPRIGAYLEQSTRYIAYDSPMDEEGSDGPPGARWRYWRGEAHPLTVVPPLPGFTACRIDDVTLEIEVPRGADINTLFVALSAHGIKVDSLRNKTNRLEELFIGLVNNKEGTA